MAPRKPGGPRGPLRPVLNTAAAVTRMVVSDGRIKYITGGPRRALEPGTELGVKDIGTKADVVAGVRDFVRNRLHEIPVMHVGALINAHALGIADPESFFTNGVQAMFDYTGRLGLAPLDEMALLCGNDTFGRAGKMISRQERIRRIVEAQLAAASELQVHALNYDYRVIYGSRLLPTMVEHTRNFVNRYGYEHGGRFELRQTYVVDRLPFRTGINAVHQYRAPQIVGNAFAASSDSLVFGINGAISLQYKALSTLDALAKGGIRFTTSGGVITGVEGPNLLAQVVSDGLRAKRRNFRVPDGKVAAWTSVSAPPAGTANWHGLLPQTLAIADSSYLMNQVVEVVERAFVETGRTVIDPMVHIRVPKYRQAMIRDILGSSIRRLADEDMDDLARRGAVERYMETRLATLEAGANAELAKSHVVSAIGRQLSVRIIASHQAARLIEFLETQGVVPVGVLTEEML